MRRIPQADSDYHFLPLFDWAARRGVKLTPGGRAVKRRTRLPPAVANVVAELAGIGREASREADAP